MKPVNMTLFGSRVFADVIKLRWGHPGVGWPYIQYDWCPYETQIERGQHPCDIRVRDHSAAAGSQGTPRKAGEHQRLEERILPQSLQENTALPAPGFGTWSPQNRETINFCCFNVTQFAVLGYGSSRNWYSSLRPHFCLLSFTKIPNCFFCHPSRDHRRNLSNPHQTTSLLCSGLSDGFHPTIAHCPLLREQLPPCPLLTLLRHAGLTAIPPTCQVSSFLRIPCLRPPPPGDCVAPTFMSLRPREAPAPQGGSQDVSPPLSLSHPPHKNRSPVRAGPCPLLLHRLPHVSGT